MPLRSLGCAAEHSEADLHAALRAPRQLVTDFLRQSERQSRPRDEPALPNYDEAVASYEVNERAVARARRLIDSRQYVLRSNWGEVQPSAEDENRYLESHSWDEYEEWHLGLTQGATEHTKARYAFVYGDFRRLHRSGLIACVYRAAEWRHKAVELAAHDLLQHLDAKTGR